MVDEKLRSTRHISVFIALVLFAFGNDIGGAQDPPSADDKLPAEKETVSKQADPKTKELTKELKQGGFTQAERIARVQTLLDRELSRQAETQRLLDDLQNEFDEASEAFRQIDEEYLAKRSRLRTSTEEQEKGELQAEIDQLHDKWTAARSHFNAIIARQKIAQQQLNTITEKVTLGQEILDFLVKGGVDAVDAESLGTKTKSDSAPEAPEQAKQQDAAESKQPSASPIETLVPGASAITDPKSNKLDQEKKKEELDVVVSDERLADARRTVKQREQALDGTLRELDLLEKGVELFERDLANAEGVVVAARESLAEAEQSVKALDAQIQTVSQSGDAARLEELRREREQSLQDVEASRGELERQSARVVEVRTMLEQLRASRVNAAERVNEARDELESAQNRLWFVESPFAPHRLMTWVVKNGPKILGVLLLMFLAWWITKLIGAKLVGGLVRRSRHGTPESRQMRAETMRRVFQSTADVAVFVLGTLAIMEIAGMDVTVLLGGAAVIGAAIAFGSQNLIRDYFSGFMMLLENQYSVGDVIRIAGVSGQVEDITLRMTALRDEEGIVHFVPHSQVTAVSNMTHGWSRAVFKIEIGYNEDVDEVMRVLMELARGIRQDPQFGPQIIADPEMLGVDSLSDSATVVKFLIKTRPMKQWGVKREMLRRIKDKFVELGIEMPVPHRVVHYRPYPSADDDDPEVEGRSDHKQTG